MRKNPNYEDVVAGEPTRVAPHPSQVERPKPVQAAPPPKKEVQAEEPPRRKKRAKKDAVSE